ncbi:Golgi-associated plant pathogenesis-related protein 1-like isoform X2 [Drosophila ficusphila]|uniref:Golgi-associated plant pathogenesis-related protein 1-like isoform X2 n=1 Tax=Drosophila ficusphila TaxID=30025 RepID=UPI0007E81F8F|nr:Golgi-associated plant pathogenesis-related protein 1-like isoform X2 [Drosophila ficusphila]
MRKYVPCELAEKDEMTHSERAGHDYAENLCYRSRRHEKCVQEWYDEIKIYDFNNPVFKKKTAHFTALVWKETKKMGYGQAKSKRGITYVVVRYTPTGNMPGEFKENVPKPIKKRRSSPREVETNNSNLPQVHAILVLLTFFLLFKTRSKW